MTPSFLPRPLRDPPPLVLPPGDGSEPSTALVPPPVPCIPSPPPGPACCAALKMAAALRGLLRRAVPAAGRTLTAQPLLCARRRLTLEIVAFSNKANEFHDVNCEVVAVSVDSHFCHLAWINTPRKSGGLGKMNIPVLSDLTKQISRDYGVLLEGPGIALRGLFIIDPNGIIKHLSINDLPVGRSVEETLRLVKAFQYVETHGEVCPANWTPDSPTIKPSPEASKEYFEKVHT
ncbi:thioredoxin-dependent peroxide reductase, mitochondrial isoform X2 [Gallus gallus]|uniref:Thioredoxin-dependent peroxide reductase, mitochondrial n=1 Tax=Gallus gallus TaxID=9031 RepID=A0A8V0XF24_CHICK|nr:thioredoxin-dependent peroxide reductase, mitochondrial isoform X2 [Gallus gallus]XP_040558831.1 thioredoxin-dependent peroxide reductase, mitochondrial isoform X2 [Gallus gallus]